MQGTCWYVRSYRDADERVVCSENIPALGDQVAHCAREIGRSTLSQCVHHCLKEPMGLTASSAPPRVPSVRSRTNAAWTPIVSRT